MKKNNVFLYGTAVKKKWTEQIRCKIRGNKIIPKLAIIQVGDRPDSNLYIKNKIKLSNELNVYTNLIKLEENISEKDLLERIQKLNTNPNINGIIVQLPLPDHIDEFKVHTAISPIKDVDGFNEVNVGKTLLGVDSLISCTPLGIMKLFNYYNIDLPGKNVVIVGRSNIVGKPMSTLLINKGATVTICNSKTKNLKDITKLADIVIIATGKAKYFNSKYFSDNQVIVDVGVNFDKFGKQCGDVDTDDLMSNLNNIKLVPSPNGCGQTTVSALFHNTVKATLLQEKNKTIHY